MSFLTEGMTIPRRRLLSVTILIAVETFSESKLMERRLREHAEKWENWSGNPSNIINHEEQTITRLEKFVVSS